MANCYPVARAIASCVYTSALNPSSTVRKIRLLSLNDLPKDKVSWHYISCLDAIPWSSRSVGPATAEAEDEDDSIKETRLKRHSKPVIRQDRQCFGQILPRVLID
jgi:hypothetical protein